MRELIEDGAMLQDKVAIVTGAGSGLGTATALAMAREGATVMLTDKDAASVEAASEEVAAVGGRSAFLATNVTDEDAVREMVERTVADFGRLDIAFNSAGIEGKHGPVHDQDLDEVERTSTYY